MGEFSEEDAGVDVHADECYVGLAIKRDGESKGLRSPISRVQSQLRK